MRLSDYIVEFLIEKGVTDCFTVVGSHTAPINNSFGSHDGIKCTRMHHEQSAAMAAESYARYSGRPAAVCLDPGPGGTNAITGVLGGFLDSLPMFVVSSQVPYDTTVRYEAGLSGDSESIPYVDALYGKREINLPRAIGELEYDITQIADHFCKYAVMIEEPSGIRYHLEKAWHLMTTGRPGPVWIDVPENFQETEVDPDSQRNYEPENETISSAMAAAMVRETLSQLREAEHPVIYAGGGVRISGAFDAFRQLVDKLGVPVCTYWNSIDLMEDTHPLYCGRAGTNGNDAGNQAIQNADLVLVLGSHLFLSQVGHEFRDWAPAARVIMVDIDESEMDKHTLHVNRKIRCDAKVFIELMLEELSYLEGSFDLGNYLSPAEDWRQQCIKWKEAGLEGAQKQPEPGENPVRVCCFIRALSRELSENSITAVGNGDCNIACQQGYVIKKGSRFIINNGVGGKGYGLPAAIGLSIASGGAEAICIESGSSLMMNLQELQTIITNKLPVRIFLTGTTESATGSGVGDISFPSYRKLAEAFGYRYLSITTGKELSSGIRQALETPAPLICEVVTE